MALNGYDSVKSLRDEDDLDRWRFAAEIVEIILSTPQDWSARIGIFGKWGEGKSTVLRFAERMLTAKGSITFWFNPWAIRGWDELWEEFGDCLYEALSAASIPVDDSWKQKAREVTRWLETKGVTQIAVAGAAAAGSEKAVSAALCMLNRWLKYDGAQIRSIREKLGDKRLVVLIDDLDRCSPELVPQLLLSLRELLDLPGFTFLLAFDDEIIGRALVDKNPAWDAGSDFLEKILDFRFHLPGITPQQKQRLVGRAMTKYCAFVPPESATEIRDLLPNNPRKLKALIRSLSALGPQIARHDADELNWVDIWLAQMLRLESHAFFEALLAGDTIDREIGMLYRLSRNRSDSRFNDKSKDNNETLKRLIDDVGIKDATRFQRLIRLVEACRARASANFRYACEMTSRPHAITWKEFRSFYDRWQLDRKVTVVADWIEHHATERSLDVDDVEDELFETIITRRNACLSAAAETASMAEHDKYINEAAALLELAKQDLLSLSKLSVLRFQKLYGQISYWIAFRKNLSDSELRDQEEAAIIELLNGAHSELVIGLFEIVIAESWHPGFDEGAALKENLQCKCRAVLSRRAAQQAMSFLTREGGIQSLTEHGRLSGVRYCLFHPDSPIWKTTLKDQFLKLITTGLTDGVVYTNVCSLFDLLLDGLNHRIDTISKEDIQVVLSNRDFVRAVWQVATSRPIQWRMMSRYIQARHSLMGAGVVAADLPLSEELEARSKQDEQPKPANQTGEATQSTQVPDENPANS